MADQEALEQWKGFLEKYLKAEAPTGFTVKENWEFMKEPVEPGVVGWMASDNG